MNSTDENQSNGTNMMLGAVPDFKKACIDALKLQAESFYAISHGQKEGSISRAFFTGKYDATMIAIEIVKSIE